MMLNCSVDSGGSSGGYGGSGVGSGGSSGALCFGTLFPGGGFDLEGSIISGAVHFGQARGAAHFFMVKERGTLKMELAKGSKRAYIQQILPVSMGQTLVAVRSSAHWLDQNREISYRGSRVVFVQPAERPAHTQSKTLKEAQRSRTHL
jgi:hypothetical protein